MLEKGQMAPDFRLPTMDGGDLRLYACRHRKNVLLLFVPEFSDAVEAHVIIPIAERYVEVREVNAEVVVVSATRPSGAKRLCDLPFPIAIDEGGEVASRYLGRRGFSTARCGVFVVDRYGELWAQWPNVTPSEAPSPQELLDGLDLIELQCPECGVSHWPN